MRRRLAVLALGLVTLGATLAAGQNPPPPPPPPTPVLPGVIGGIPQGRGVGQGRGDVGAPNQGRSTQPPPPLVTTGLIVGSVIDPATGKGVGGAIVTLNGGPARTAAPVAPGGRPTVAPPAPPPQILTDQEGRFAFMNLVRANYTLSATKTGYAAGAYGRMRPNGPSRPIQVDDGEKVSDVTVRLFKYASITGALVDDAGEPVVSTTVRAYRRVLTSGRRVLTPTGNQAQTDDRGVYRIYGLQPGRYRVSVGQAGEETGGVSFGRRRIFRRTYHPDVTEQAQARIVEVKSGGEVENVDITLGKPIKTFKASGRFLLAETGEPVPNLLYGYGTLNPAGRQVGSFGGGQTTNARGEFLSEGLAPGRYVIFNMPAQEPTEFYTESTPFEIGDADV